MSLRDDVRWVREAADGLLVGWLPGRLPKWSTSEGEQLGWLVLLLWRKFYDASMARTVLEAEVQTLKGDVDGLRATNERLTDLLDQPEREEVVEALAVTGRQIGNYWVQEFDGDPMEIALWDGTVWLTCGSAVGSAEVHRVLSNRIPEP